MNLVEFKGTGPMQGGTVAINPQYVASVYTSEGSTAIVLSNGIGYHVEGTRAEVLAALNPTKH